jgi:hypothetical protein
MFKKIGIGIAVLGAVAFGVYLRIIRPWQRRWGATDDELRRTLLGDELVPNPKYQTALALTIQAKPAVIWPWLAQIGQGRGGFYSYKWIENLLGADIHNVDRIHPEWQLKVGDLVRMYHEGAGPPPYQVAAIEPGQALILGHPLDKASTSGAAWGDSWSFVLQPIDQQNTRLIMRMRTSPEMPGYVHVINYVLEPGYFLMFRGMLLGIKQRAEHAYRQTPEPGEVGTPTR